jgi:pyrroloquinoline-quinone synthase
MTTLHASALSAPPSPAIPPLDTPLAPDDLAAALRALSGSYYANHPFHTLMHEGRLTERQLQGWVANRLAYQRAIPRKDAAILSNCPDPEVRRIWMQRIVDHDGTEPGSGGIEMWIRLGVASSLTELFAPDLMRRRIAAFPQHYPWVRPEALDYFKSRLTQAPRDSQHGLRLVLTHCTTVETQRRAFAALAFKLELLWAMIDTIHNAYLDK